MSNERILRKIEHCLALSASSNPNEAAAALRQAKKLMEIHNVTEDTLNESKISVFQSECSERGRVSNKHTGWLASAIAKCFGVYVYVNNRQATKWTSDYTMYFWGPSADAEVATYTFDVLFRQLQDQRAEYMKTISGTPLEKQKKAKWFCEGWATGVVTTVRQFAGDMDPARKAMMDRYKEKNLAINASRPRKRQQMTADRAQATNAGHDQGQKAKLFGATTHTSQHQLSRD